MKVRLQLREGFRKYDLKVYSDVQQVGPVDSIYYRIPYGKMGAAQVPSTLLRPEKLRRKFTPGSELKM